MPRSSSCGRSAASPLLRGQIRTRSRPPSKKLRVPDDGFSIRYRSAPEPGQPSSSPPVMEIEASQSSLDSFRTARLLAERLTAVHLSLRRMDQNESFMGGLTKGTPLNESFVSRIA
jgi:hypothetical protein